jgi:H/ACA ribonucleoprotein complex subunit 3
MRIRRCHSCGSYTLKDACIKCNVPAVAVGPARYSPQDPYGRYRRLMKDKMQNG